MNRLIGFGLMTSLFALLGVVQLAAAHPADGQPTLIDKGQFHLGSAYPEAWTSGDIVFTGPEERPRTDQLTAADWYILAGATRSSFSSEALMPWGSLIFVAVNSYYKHFGKVPAVLDDTELRKLPGYSKWTDEQLSLFRRGLRL